MSLDRVLEAADRILQERDALRAENERLRILLRAVVARWPDYESGALLPSIKTELERKP